jgi:hypothetical protein
MISSEKSYPVHVKLPDENMPLSSFIRDNPKFSPFTEDCDGALDGTHVNSFVPEEWMAYYHNHKRGLSQNELAACSFKLFFKYILSGWEGSAADSQVYDDALRTDFATRPRNYLADAGFPACDHLLVSYRGPWCTLSSKSVELSWCCYQVCG